MIKLEKAVDVSIATHKLICIYGKGGSGKTHFAINNKFAPKTLILICEDDGGLSTVNNIPPEISANIFAKHVDFKIGSPVGVLRQLLTHVRDSKDLGIQTLILDPFTNIREKQAAYISQTEYGGKKLSFDGWADVKSTMNALLNLIVELKLYMHVIVICHEDVCDKTDSFTNKTTVQIRPLCGELTANKFEQFCDEVVRVSRGVDGTRTFDLGSNSMVMAKTRKYGHATPEQLLIGDALTIDALL